MRRRRRRSELISSFPPIDKIRLASSSSSSLCNLYQTWYFSSYSLLGKPSLNVTLSFGFICLLRVDDVPPLLHLPRVLKN
jgi:hypothetical protein